jgi:RNA:NAD 2'-phosphotransferase (TPT1/KptA family)
MMGARNRRRPERGECDAQCRAVLARARDLPVSVLFSVVLRHTNTSAPTAMLR